VTVVDTEIGGDEYQFTFDARTHLLVRLTAPTSAATARVEYHLDDYALVDGLYVPLTITTVKLSHGKEWMKWTERATYAFDVDYDERIFVEPPNLTMGAKGWARRD
jgi:hypothetical protein